MSNNYYIFDTLNIKKMASKLIGWSNESNLLWEISQKIQYLTKITAQTGGGTTYYNTPNIYNVVGDLPISFAANTIHSFSIQSRSGDTSVDVNGVTCVLLEGEVLEIKADTLIDKEITINSASGTFQAITMV